jgi:DNA-binding XRE family transcriptional regulator
MVISMAKSFDDLVQRTTSIPTQQRAAVRTRQLLEELLLAEVRRRTGKTQRQVAAALGIRQPSLSKLEGRPDMQISTLRRIVAALGGELDVIARFPTGEVRLGPFSARPSRTRRRPTSSTVLRS